MLEIRSSEVTENGRVRLKVESKQNLLACLYKLVGMSDWINMTWSYATRAIDYCRTRNKDQ